MSSAPLSFSVQRSSLASGVTVVVGKSSRLSTLLLQDNEVAHGSPTSVNETPASEPGPGMLSRFCGKRNGRNRTGGRRKSQPLRSPLFLLSAELGEFGQFFCPICTSFTLPQLSADEGSRCGTFGTTDLHPKTSLRTVFPRDTTVYGAPTTPTVPSDDDCRSTGKGRLDVPGHGRMFTFLHSVVSARSGVGRGRPFQDD